MQIYEAHLNYTKTIFLPSNWLESYKEVMIGIEEAARKGIDDISELQLIETDTNCDKFDDVEVFNCSRKKFKEESPKLLEKLEGKFVAFVGNEMEVGDDEESLVSKVIKKYGNIPFYVDKVTPEEDEPLIMISPKISHLSE